MVQRTYSYKVEEFCDSLRQRRIENSLAAAKGTAELLRQVIASSRMSEPKGMLEEVRNVGIKIQSAKPIGKPGRKYLTVDIFSFVFYF